MEEIQLLHYCMHEKMENGKLITFIDDQGSRGMHGYMVEVFSLKTRIHFPLASIRSI